MSLTPNRCIKMSQTMNYSKTLRKTSPEKIVVLMTTSNQKRISPINTRRICAPKELSTLYSYMFHSVYKKML